jgi:tetratricopeptide (TPR) repeat protein
MNQTPKPALKERPILLGFAVQRRQPDGKITVSLRWLRILSVFFALFVAAWVSTAGALYFWFKYNKSFDVVTFADMVTLPFRLDEHRQEMGDYHVEKGIESLNESSYREALTYLRLGVTRSPGNLEGRLLLSEFYEQLLKRTDIAAGLLCKGLELGGIDDINYLKKTIRLLLRHQLDADIQKIADTYLPEVKEINDRNRILAFGAAQANFLRGNYDRADDYISIYELNVSIEGVLLSAQISWNRGHQEAAVKKLELNLKTFEKNESILMQLSRYYRELGKIEEARKYAILRNLANPLSAAPRIELLYIYNKSGDTEREEKETRRILKQFSDDSLALQAIANFAADSGNIQLARHCYEEALESEFEIDSFALLMIETHLVDSDFEGALSFAEELDKERPDWLIKRRDVFNSLRAVASYGINRPDFGDIYLNEFLSGENIGPQQFFAVARRLIKIEQPHKARRVLVKAFELTPTNQMVLAELIKIELQLGYTENLNNLLKRFLQMRRPQPEIIVEAYRKLGSDRFIFTPNRESLLIDLSTMIRENAETTARFQSEES